MRWLGLVLLLLLTSCGLEYGYESPIQPANIPQIIEPQEPEWWEDRITQIPIPQINLLFIIDDSCSMGNDQDALANEMPPLIEAIHASDLDYRIGITTTNGVGNLHVFENKYWIDRNTTDPVETFSAGVMVGLFGGWERGLYSMYSVFTNDNTQDFFRPDSHLYIFVVSDEPDQTDPVANMTEDDMWSALKIKEEYSGRLSFTTIAIWPDSPICPNIYADPSRYMQVTKEYPGIAIDLCAEDWTPAINHLTREALKVRYRYHLTRTPIPSTITILLEIDGIIYKYYREEDWIYKPASNQIEFLHLTPPQDSVFIARYMLADTAYDVCFDTGDTSTP